MVPDNNMSELKGTVNIDRIGEWSLEPRKKIKNFYEN